jgi:hypothetical protein
MKYQIWLKDYPRSIKVFHWVNRIITLNGTKFTNSEHVKYDTIKELLFYSFEGIIGSLKLTDRELIVSNECDDENCRRANIDIFVK